MLRPNRLGLLAIATVVLPLGRTAVAQEGKAPNAIGTIERVDPRFDKLVPRGAVLEKVADGYDWAEGPVWVPKEGGYLLFSDVPQNTVYRWKSGEGAKVFLKPSGYTGPIPRGGEPGSNGLVLDPSGHLVLMQHGDRRVARLGEDGKFITLADRYRGKRLSSPNDGAYRSNGDLYFTDPPYGLLKQNDDPAKELDFNGVYRLLKNGELTLLTKEMTRPNGIAFSPDEKTLYVANSDPEKAVWMAFEVKGDGTLGSGRVFYDATKWVGNDRPGLPDGMKVDVSGNLFATGPGGVLVFSPDGTYLGRFNTGVPTANCGWGEDGSTLFVTADNAIGRVKLDTRGKGF